MIPKRKEYFTFLATAIEKLTVSFLYRALTGMPIYAAGY
jgi:hypothetical protein